MDRNRKERRRLASELRRRRRAARYEAVDEEGPFIARAPFADIPKEVIQAGMVEVGRMAAENLPTLRHELIELIKQCEPTYFLSSMAYAALTIGISDDGKLSKPKTSVWDKKLQQHHIEFAQAVYLTIPVNELSFRPTDPNKVQEISDKIFETSEAFHQARFLQIETAATEQQKRLFSLQERIRLHTQAVRNWGYYTQVLRILRDLYSPLDYHCEQIVGLKATDLIIIFDRMLRSVEECLSDYRQKLADAFAKNTKRALIEEYNRQFGLPDEQTTELMEIIKKYKWSRQHVISFLLSHSGLYLTDIFRFHVDSIATWVAADQMAISSALDNLAYSFGDLTDFDFEHLFLGNPVWQKPLVKEGDQTYFCCLPQLFFGFSFHIFDSIFSSEPRAHRAHASRRSEFLEKQIVEAFSWAFGDPTIHSNVPWKHDGEMFETDLLIQLDTQLFIIEAKSHKISWPALRGAPKRIKRHVDEILIAPATQSKRLEAAIREWQNGEKPNFEIETKIDLSAVREITRLSVTLEDFAMVQSDLKAIDGTGLLEPDFPTAVTMSLADLQCVFDILEGPIEKIYYLQRRVDIQNSIDYLGDEMDLLGLYIDTGFNLGQIEEGETGLVVVDMSVNIDEYYQALDQGIQRKKPRRKMTTWFGDIKERLASRKPSRWTEAALMLLILSYEDQQRIEAHFNKLKRTLLKRRPKEPGAGNTTAVLPPEWGKVGFACVAYYKDETDDRLAIMESGAMTVFENSNAERCLVIARDVEGRSYPYSTLAVYDRPRDFES